jgi:hypothetical protein
VTYLDIILVSIEWEVKYPLARVTILPKGVSDHNPLKITFGDRTLVKEPVFRFEKWWFEREDFDELVKNTWDIEFSCSDLVDVYQFKIRTLREKLKGWSRNIDAEMKKKKKTILSKVDGHDKLVEHHQLVDQDVARRKELKKEIAQIWNIEEIKARQR